MQEAERKQITPGEAAAAMMQFTMRSIEHGWAAVKPAMAAYMPGAELSEAQEDELVKEMYIAALSLEVYCIPHAFDAETARSVGAGMDEIMTSGSFSPHRLAEPICTGYVPRFQRISEQGSADLAMALMEEAARVLYDRLPLPLKPREREGSLLWIKLLQFLPQLIGKWPVLAAKFDICAE